MCSTNTDNDVGVDSEEFASRVTIADSSKKACSKCKTEPPTVSIHGNAICKECFLIVCDHKFRAELTKFMKEFSRGAQLAHNAKRLVLSFSGGVSSLVLLHQLVSDRAKKRISPDMEIIVLFVKEPGISEAWLSNVTSYLESICSRSVKWQVIPFQDNLDLVASKSLGADSMQQAIQLERNRTIWNFALDQKADGVIFSSCQTSLAVNLLRDVSLGYAERAAYASAIVDRLTCFGVPVGRPLRALSSKEVALMFRFMGVKALPFLDLNMTKFGGPAASVGLFCQNMIAEVGAEYPSTASTAFRTGAKLDTEIKPNENTTKCKICYSWFDCDSSSPTPSICYGCRSLGMEKLLPLLKTDTDDDPLTESSS